MPDGGQLLGHGGQFVDEPLHAVQAVVLARQAADGRVHAAPDLVLDDQRPGRSGSAPTTMWVEATVRPLSATILATSR